MPMSPPESEPLDQAGVPERLAGGRLTRRREGLAPAAESLHGELLRLDADQEPQSLLPGAISHLREMQALCWRAVAAGDLEAPRAALGLLRPLGAFADSMAAQKPQTAPLATEIRGALWSLHVGHQSLAELRTEVRLLDERRSPSEREVIRVLAEAKGQYLRRAQVHEAMRLDPRPTPSWIGQILAEMHDDGLLQRVQLTAQGNPETSFYQLSAAGEQLAQRLHPSPAGTEIDPEVAELVRLAGSHSVSPAARRVRIGWLVRASLREGGAAIARAAMASYLQCRGSADESTSGEVFAAVLEGLFTARVIEPRGDGTYVLRTDETAWRDVPERLYDPSEGDARNREDQRPALEAVVAECLFTGVFTGAVALQDA